MDDLDSAAVAANYEKARSAAAAADTGSMAEAEAMVEMEVNRAMGIALGLPMQ